MSKKNIPVSGIVYSTDPGFSPSANNEAETATPAPELQKLRVRLETKHRAGKAVTLIEGFTGTAADREEIGKKIKRYCGTGGAVKDAEIMVQGDHRDKVLQWLLKEGYKHSRRL